MSKGLEALKEIKNSYSWANPQREDRDNFAIIEKELKDYEETKQDLEQVMKDYQDLGNRVYKELKALEIIKNKKVNVIILLGCDSLEEYNKHPLTWNKLTQEEYDLLKEVLL